MGTGVCKSSLYNRQSFPWLYGFHTFPQLASWNLKTPPRQPDPRISHRVVVFALHSVLVMSGNHRAWVGLLRWTDRASILFIDSRRLRLSFRIPSNPFESQSVLSVGPWFGQARIPTPFREHGVRRPRTPPVKTSARTVSQSKDWECFSRDNHDSVRKLSCQASEVYFVRVTPYCSIFIP